MKESKKYSLKEAIKTFYITEPLKTDLATAVADKVFIKHTRRFSVLDRWLYIFAAILISGTLIYSFNFLSQLPFTSALLFIITAGGLFGLSVKEFSLISKKLQY